ncbi:hypothetical protein PybrP1_003718 [[Pythium] brassicae (nom. inval.)]|nr:hypothetical protein PybrP1_003718 [[Pythium] brassicae (nom. inval.)]
MPVALAFEADDGSRAIHATVELAPLDGVRAADTDVATFYEIARTAEQLRVGGFRAVALQFPDSLLPDAPRVQRELTAALGERFAVADGSARVFVLGDTSYGSCCVDEVAAQHLAADCVVHYGRTCLSATSKLPVAYVFGRAPIDIDACVDTLGALVSRDIAPEKAVLLLYEPSYHHAVPEIVSRLQERVGGERRLLAGDMATFYNPLDGNSSAEPAPTVLGGQQIRLRDSESERDVTPDKFVIVYIGAESPHLTSILLRHSALACFSYHPSAQTVRREGASVNRALMRRFFLVQQAKEAQIFGILMGTLGVSKFLDVVQSLQQLIKKSGRKSYLFVVGKVNVPKLANYAEIDAFVLVACQQNTLMDSKEFYKPIVTPYELQLALSPNGDEWTGEYKTDFREVLPALTRTTQALVADDERGVADDAPFFSLVTGTYKSSSRAANGASSESASSLLLQVDENETAAAATALQVKDAQSQLTAYRSEAAEYLATREYRGLEPRIGETPAHAAVVGATGIAREYTHER